MSFVCENVLADMRCTLVLGRKKRDLISIEFAISSSVLACVQMKLNSLSPSTDFALSRQFMRFCALFVSLLWLCLNFLFFYYMVLCLLIC